jgi:hypothetical protein
MPWCEDCAKYWAPSAMRPDGACPTCGRVLQETPRQPITAKNLDVRALAEGDDGEEVRAPWHFKILMVALAVYLAWRVVDLVV